MIACGLVGDENQYDSPTDRRNGETQRRRDALEAHNNDAYAHGRMINRLLQENVTLRERFENRLSALERFRAQATLVGGLSLLALGALGYAVASKLIH